MRVHKIFDTAGSTFGGDFPEDGTSIAVSTKNSKWVDFDNLRGDKVLLLLEWDGNGAFLMRMHALMDQIGGVISPVVDPGLVAYVPMTVDTSELTAATAITANNNDGPFTFRGDSTNNTFHAYMTKMPRMRLQLRNITGTPSVNAWLIG